MRWLLSIVLILAAAGAKAADVAPVPADVVAPAPVPSDVVASRFFIDEVRIGGSVNVNRVRKDDDERVYTHLDILFAPPTWQIFENRFLNSYFTPRFTIGGAISPTGGTNMAFAGFTWDTTLTDILSLFTTVQDPSLTDRIFLTRFFGGAIHDGEVDEDDDDKRHFGCRVLFREEAGLGFKITPNLNVIGFWDHESNLNLCSDNDGLTRVGGKLGFKF